MGRRKIVVSDSKCSKNSGDPFDEVPVETCSTSSRDSFSGGTKKKKTRTKKGPLEEIAEKYPLVRSVIDGDATLEETLLGYEEEFYTLSKRGARLIKVDKKLKDDIKNYESKLNEFIKMVEQVSYAELGMERPDISKHIIMEREIKKDKFYVAGAVAAIFGYITFPLTFYLWEKHEKVWYAQKYIERVDDLFDYLRNRTHEADLTIRKTYITDYIKDRPELFKETYAQMKKNEQKKVRKKLEEMIELGVMDMSMTELEEFLKEIDS